MPDLRALSKDIAAAAIGAIDIAILLNRQKYPGVTKRSVATITSNGDCIHFDDLHGLTHRGIQLLLFCG